LLDGLQALQELCSSSSSSGGTAQQQDDASVNSLVMESCLRGLLCDELNTLQELCSTTFSHNLQW
jgi:hypothetical protein